ncbi:MAG: hypothetical protein IPP43_08950 [Chitinophagaceae bacterium]|nr:hypothetical protein [Chitinophagaceae bacterium]MBL0131220.1 hypothetical protein [Chitinophagaceae bacterium]MBL0273168.1 hypothetical protein [Chitinophagaceae bacterium]
MKSFVLFMSLLFLSFGTHAQELSQVTFSLGKNLSSLTFLTDQAILIKISADGKVLEWGTDPGPGRYYNDPARWQPYIGRVDYYGPEYDSVLRGKVKSIGTCSLSYFGIYEPGPKCGKLKTIGSVALEYYDDYENEAFKGKLKFAGTVLFTFYGAYDNEALRGKLKSVGNTSITYYTTFDDKLISGKLKSIGMFNYTWYASFDRREFQGAMKSGPVSQLINGVTYLIR